MADPNLSHFGVGYTKGFNDILDGCPPCWGRGEASLPGGLWKEKNQIPDEMSVPGQAWQINRNNESQNY